MDTVLEAGTVLEVAGLSKSFGGQKALDAVDLHIRRGEIHALVGQNGSGKSTVIKLLAGFHKPDAGQVTLDGSELDLGNADASFHGGLRFVHQDLALVPALDAIDNLALGRGYRKNRAGGIAWRAERQAGRQLLETLGFELDLNTPVGRLPASQRTAVAIARAIEGIETSRVKVLVLDEPTASLPVAESSRLFEVIRRVNQAGVAVIYVSHRFGEVFEIAERVTVLRDGRVVATRDVRDIDSHQLTTLTVGRELDSSMAAGDTDLGPAERRRSVLVARNLSGNVLRNIDLEVGAGRIVGLAGLTGSGREEIVPLLSGALARTGTVMVDGVQIPPLRPDIAMKTGMGVVPAERLANGAFANMSLRENITIARLDGFFALSGLRKRAEIRETDRWLARLDVVPRATEAKLITLSGGNQQKIMLARALRLSPKALVVDEPTQGVDVGAKAAIHDVIRQAARDGASVVVASTDLEELLGLCDRIVVLADGQITGSYDAQTLDLARFTSLVMHSVATV